MSASQVQAIDSIDSVEVLKLIQDDNYTAKHCWRVAYYAELIAKELGLNEVDVHLVREAALIHDVGKIGVEREILLKPDSLDEDEMNSIKRHPLVSASIATHLSNNPSIIQVIAQHHEQPDGQGYPNGLKGRQIDLKAAILRVADAFDAMTT
ncbi:HD domain-containing protein [archaeon]|nr:HD domain-containing protein [archaeon]